MSVETAQILLIEDDTQDVELLRFTLQGSNLEYRLSVVHHGG